jgi:hypothetical protein
MTPSHFAAAGKPRPSDCGSAGATGTRRMPPVVMAMTYGGDRVDVIVHPRHR